MAKTTREVVQAFVQGRPAGCGNLTTDGVKLYSYGVPVVARTDGRNAIRTSRRYSVTTSKHTNAGAAALAREGFQITEGDL